MFSGYSTAVNLQRRPAGTQGVAVRALPVPHTWYVGEWGIAGDKTGLHVANGLFHLRSAPEPVHLL